MKIRSGEINKQDLEDCMVIPLLIQIMVSECRWFGVVVYLVWWDCFGGIRFSEIRFVGFVL